MTYVTDQTIDEMVKIVVEEFSPEKVILFGSRASGQSRPDSDVDFLVIERAPFGPRRSRRRELSRIRRALWDFMIPIDILLYSEKEVKTWKNSLNHIIGRSLREGKVLYERS